MIVAKWGGRKITNPGIYRGVPMDAYHGAALCDGLSVSSSAMRTIMNESPAHYWAFSPYNPSRAEEKETDALALGRAAHHLLLGEDDFSTLFVARPDRWDSWRTNDAKAWKADQEAQGRTVLLPNQLEQIRGMARSLAKHPLVQAGILNGEIEHTIVAKHKETGLWLKGRPDAIPNDSGDFADLKTTVSVQTADLARAIAEHGYHQQAALIAYIWHAITGSDIASFSFVFVEKTPPFCCRVVTLKDTDLARGERQNEVAIKRFAECMESGEWPGPGSADAEYLELPEWAQKKIDSQLEKAEAA